MNFKNNIKSIYFSTVVILTLLLFFVFLLLHEYAYNYEKSKIDISANSLLHSTLSKEIVKYHNNELDTLLTDQLYFKNTLIPAIKKSVSDSLEIENAIIVITSTLNNEVVASSAENLNNKWNKTPVSSNTCTYNKGIGHYYTCYYYIPNYKALIIFKLKQPMLMTLLIIILFIATFIFIFRRWFSSNKESKLKDDFFQNITHELKTPIATTFIAADIFKKFDYDLPKDKVESYILIIKEENRKMKQIVDRLLSISIIENSASKMNITEVNIHELLKKEIKNFDIIIAEQNGSIENIFEAKEYTVAGDYSFITMIFTNLIDNAIKYSPTNPTIEISTKSNNSGVSVTVSDNGIGIPNDTLSKIYNKTFRINNGFNIKGFGLGLYFVKQLVDIHKGKISATSELGRGSKFTVFLPFKINK